MKKLFLLLACASMPGLMIASHAGLSEKAVVAAAEKATEKLFREHYAADFTRISQALETIHPADPKFNEFYEESKTKLDPAEFLYAVEKLPEVVYAREINKNAGWVPQALHIHEYAMNFLQEDFRANSRKHKLPSGDPDKISMYNEYGEKAANKITAKYSGQYKRLNEMIDRARSREELATVETELDETVRTVGKEIHANLAIGMVDTENVKNPRLFAQRILKPFTKLQEQLTVKIETNNRLLREKALAQAKPESEMKLAGKTEIPAIKKEVYQTLTNLQELVAKKTKYFAGILKPGLSKNLIVAHGKALEKLQSEIREQTIILRKRADNISEEFGHTIGGEVSKISEDLQKLATQYTAAAKSAPDKS